MKNFVQKGDSVSLIAPAGGVVGGAGVLIGTTFVVAMQTAAVGAAFEGLSRGVVDHPKNAVAIAAGDKAYWDNTAKKVTNVATSNTLIGWFTAAALSGDANGRVSLTGQV